jgi:hypothetical protein
MKITLDTDFKYIEPTTTFDELLPGDVFRMAENTLEFAIENDFIYIKIIANKYDTVGCVQLSSGKLIKLENHKLLTIIHTSELVILPND